MTTPEEQAAELLQTALPCWGLPYCSKLHNPYHDFGCPAKHRPAAVAVFAAALRARDRAAREEEVESCAAMLEWFEFPDLPTNAKAKLVFFNAVEACAAAIRTRAASTEARERGS